MLSCIECYLCDAYEMGTNFLVLEVIFVVYFNCSIWHFIFILQPHHCGLR